MSKEKVIPQRISKTKMPLNGLDRNTKRNEIIHQLLLNEISQGQALKKLRIEVLGISQIQYLKLINVSRQTLSDIENDKGNYSIETLNQVFKPMGLQLGLLPIQRSQIALLVK